MKSVAVLIPCYNEEASIATVIADFKKALPMAVIYVYDNNSTDRTCAVARGAGAVVRAEPLQGKGNVVRRMFADVEAEVYVLVDGDATYDAAAARLMVDLLMRESLDMVNGARMAEAHVYRPGHRFGNWLLTHMVAWIFGNRFSDILSGYKVFSRRFVKSFPALSAGFETETELVVHALELRMPTDEVSTMYKERLLGSQSKLSTVKDGVRILWTIFVLIKEERPMPFFSLLAFIFASLALALLVPIVVNFMETGLVLRLPTAMMSMGMMIVAFFALACGLILDTVTRGRREMKRMRYLNIPAPQASDDGV